MFITIEIYSTNNISSNESTVKNSKSGNKFAKIAIIIVSLVLVLAMGIGVGYVLFGNRNNTEKLDSKNTVEENKNESVEVENKTYTISKEYVGDWMTEDYMSTIKIENIKESEITFEWDYYGGDGYTSIDSVARLNDDGKTVKLTN